MTSHTKQFDVLQMQQDPNSLMIIVLIFPYQFFSFPHLKPKNCAIYKSSCNPKPEWVILRPEPGYGISKAVNLQMSDLPSAISICKQSSTGSVKIWLPPLLPPPPAPLPPGDITAEKLSPEPRTRTWKRKFLIPSKEGSGHWVKKEVETWKRRNIIQCKARGRFNLGGNSIAHINSTAQQTVTLATTQHPEFLGLYITALAWIHQTRDII